MTVTDVNLMFIVPSKKIDLIIYNVIHKLAIVGKRDGLSYSHLKGLSIKSSDL